MMDKVFPLKTYSGRQRRVLRPKPATETGQQLASKKNESGSDNVKNVKNTPLKRRSSIAPKSARKKRLKSPRTRSATRGQRKKSQNKNPSKTRKGSVKEQNLTFGMFGIDGECRADDLTSQGAQAETSPAVGRKNNIDLNESKKETHTLPDSVMGGQDKVSEWLSTQNKDGDSPISTPDGGRCGESADCSIEVMREEVVTAAERKEKHFGGKFFENINKVVNIASGLAQKSHKKPATPNISVEDIDIVDSPVTEKTAGKSAHLQLLELQTSTEIGTEICTTGQTTRRSSGMVPTSTRRSSATTGMELSSELGTYTMTRSSAITAKGSECSTQWSSTMTGMEPSTELGTYTMTRSAAITDTGTCTSSTGRRSSVTRESTDYCTDEVTESLAEKEKSEKTPGKQTSFAVPGSPLKKQKVKSSRKRSEGAVPRSSTRLFQTNIDQTETVPPEFYLSSIHGDAERGKFIHSEVLSGTGDVKQPIPLTPEIQIINRQPVPRLTSTPTRKTSTPNSDGYQPAQFEIDLSSVSAVHSDEEGLILHQISRDVLSDEHMDLSKTRIDENFGDLQPVNIDFGHDEISKSSRQVRGAVNKKAMSDSKITVKYSRNTDSGKRKQITKGPILRRKSSSFNASSNTSQNRTSEEISKAIMSHQSELAETCTSGKQASPRQSLFRPSALSSDHHVSSVRYPHKGLPSKSFKSTFRLKMKSPNQKKTRTGPKVKENLPFCDLGGDFVCPRRETEKIRIHRDNIKSFLERVAALPRDDLKF